MKFHMFSIFAWISLVIAFGCAAIIVFDEFRHPQKMRIMNIVWPVTGLYFSVFALWAYFRVGRGLARDAAESMSGQERSQKQQQEASRSPTVQQSALAATHCGAGCALADIVTELTIFGVGATLLGTELYASFLWDFVVAWSVGIVFQYFTIKPMRNLSVAKGIWAAIKADTLSICAFQIGMYAWMALVFFKLFPQPHLRVNQPGYWLMMQVAMICGFATSLPVNRFLIRIGWKEAMG
jgi:hypothetical protein